jgi:ribosomal protein S12 methylthiotransferase accessory factor
MDRPVESLALRRILNHTRSMPGEIGLYHHAIDYPEVPVVTAIQHADWLHKYSYYAGGGGDIDIEATLLKALNEFAQSERTIKVSQFAPDRMFSQGAGQIFDMGPDDPIEKITLFFKVISYYGHTKNMRKLDWYINSGETVQLSELPRSRETTIEGKMRELSQVLQRHGIDPIVFDVTPGPLKQVKVIKTFMPEFSHPFIMSKPLLNHPRFREAPVLLGLRDEPLTFDELNQDPLPYP